MPITVACPCGKVYKFKDEVAGRRAKCTICGRVVAIPGLRVMTPSPAAKPVRAVKPAPGRAAAPPPKPPQRSPEEEAEILAAEAAEAKEELFSRLRLAALGAVAVIVLAALAYVGLKFVLAPHAPASAADAPAPASVNASR